MSFWKTIYHAETLRTAAALYDISTTSRQNCCTRQGLVSAIWDQLLFLACRPRWLIETALADLPEPSAPSADKSQPDCTFASMRNVECCLYVAVV